MSFAIQSGLLFDILTIVRHLPEWVPGAGFKQIARVWREELEETVEIPFKFVKEQMVYFKVFCELVCRIIV